MTQTRLPLPDWLDRPPVGPASVNIRSVGFQSWLLKSPGVERWPEGPTLVRAIVGERARDAADKPLDPEAVARLSLEDLEAIASALLAELQAPEAEAATSPADDNKTATERLRIVLLARAEAFGTSMKDLGAQVATPLATAIKAVEGLGGAFATAKFTSGLEGAWRAQSGLGTLHNAERQLKAALEPAGALADIMRIQDRLVLQAIGPAAQWTKQVREIERSLGSALAFSVNAEAALAATRFADSFKSNWTHIAGASAFGETMAKLHNDIGSLGRLPFGPIAQLKDITSHYGAFGSLPISAFNDVGWLSQTLKRSFGSSVPSMLATLAALHGPYLGASETLAAIAARPGFQTAAIAGLEGLAPRGAVADVLANYIAPHDAQAPVFSHVIDGVRQLDDEAGPGLAPQAYFEELLDLIAATLARAPRLITFKGLYALLTFAMVVASLAYAKAGYEGDQAERSREHFEALQAKMERFRPEPGTKRSNVRYVHDRAVLRLAPDRDADVIRYLFPDQELHVLEANEAWAKVEAYDYAGEQPIIGWVSRRVLRIAPPPL